MVDRSHIRVKAMAYLPNAAGTHHAVLRDSDPDGGRVFHRLLGGGVELGERSEDDVVPREGGWYDDVGEPMWVEWRRCDGVDEALPLYPDGIGELLSLG